MKFCNDQSGTSTFAVGLAVLITVGVVFATLLEKRFAFSKGYQVSRSEFRVNQEMISGLRDDLEERALLFPSAGDGSVELGRVTREIGLLEQKKAEMQSTKQKLMDSTLQLQAEYSSYRAEYKNKLWARAVGENIGNLKIRGGREYQNARITRVTADGIDVVHEDGSARIPVADLDSKLRERFQLGITGSETPSTAQR